MAAVMGTDQPSSTYPSGSTLENAMTTKIVLAAVLFTILPACSVEEALETDAATVSPETAELQALNPNLPTADSSCPEFKDGYVEFHPANMPPRQVRIYMDPTARNKNGPLVLFWHGSGQQPEQAVTQAFNQQEVDTILSEGGIIAAPAEDKDAEHTWFIVGSGRMDDFRLADNVVACAAKKVGINPKRIHSVGSSAGALHTTKMSYMRSNYIASVVTYSGGLHSDNLENQNPANKFAAMIQHGGPTDIVNGFHFMEASEAYHDDLEKTGHFSLICNHGGGHGIPSNVSGVWKFLNDHPFGAKETYPGGLPDVFPDYCKR